MFGELSDPFNVFEQADSGSLWTGDVVSFLAHQMVTM